MSKQLDLLIEIGTEELPPAMQGSLVQAFSDALFKGLSNNGLTVSQRKTYATPRRLALCFTDLLAQQADQLVQRKGPALTAAYDAKGNPTKAALGFARSCKVDIKDLSTQKTDKGEWLWYEATEPGVATADLLPELISAALKNLPMPRPMRWGAGSIEFIRPVHWALILFGQQYIKTDILGVKSGEFSYGHRFHAPQGFRVTRAADYLPSLRDAKVYADMDERRAIIETQLTEQAKALGGEITSNPALLDEVTALVEWPVAIVGAFDERFLQLPREVLISTMGVHQRFFPVENAQGQLLPYFITIANIESSQPEEVKKGNERVLLPRFIDAEFFWQQDKKHPLKSYANKLSKVVYQKDLGTLADKVIRIRKSAEYLAGVLGADSTLVKQAAELAKCDLMSNMVFEFTELQGVMGRHYATLDGVDAEVCIALEEQYLPKFSGDRLPQTQTGQILAIADRCDALLGYFAIGQKPTGMKDPYALRRSGLSLVRIIIESGLDLDIAEIFANAAKSFPPELKASSCVNEVTAFCMDRLRAYYQAGDQQALHNPQYFEAIYKVQTSKPLDFDQRLNALITFVHRPEAESLAAANKRINNILKKNAVAKNFKYKPALLIEKAEKNLDKQLSKLEAAVAKKIQRRDYAASLDMLAGLKLPIDEFFDTVLVMAEDEEIKSNRIALLQRVSSLFIGIADLSVMAIDASASNKP